jgi:hypothetical protein
MEEELTGRLAFSLCRTIVLPAVLAWVALTWTSCSTRPRPSATKPPLLSFAPTKTNSAAGATGPTLRMDSGRGESPGNPIADFMYFVPLISPEPVSITQSASNTQRARVRSGQRKVTEVAFSATYDFEITGTGFQRNSFDHQDNIRRHERQLKEGGELSRVLDSITTEGSGLGTIEVEGTRTNGIATVTEVRLRFNSGGKPSPVSIGLQDIRYLNGEFRATNEMVARVNTLTFRKTTGSPRMAVTVASVKRKDAGDNLWQTFTGSLAATAANLLIKPIRVEAVGHKAMLKFGRALVAEETSFTFPRARNLKEVAKPTAP